MAAAAVVVVMVVVLFVAVDWNRVGVWW